MRIVSPDFAAAFHCLAANCLDCCCRQGWQIEVDPAHRALYETLPGELGKRVRAALSESGLRMTSGVCNLLDENGLCPIVAALGESGLCDICRTHPRFIEQYGGMREIHFSLSCPEAARLALDRSAPLTFCEEIADEPVTEPNEIDPDEFLALLRIRRFAIRLMQQRRIPILDRLALLTAFAGKVQRAMEARAYGRVAALISSFYGAEYRARLLRRLRRQRRRGVSFLPEIALLRSLETLTDEFPTVLRRAVFSVKSSRVFDRSNAVAIEHMTVLWLAHYIPKAINDGRVDSKLLLAVFLTLCTRRFCVCTGASPMHMAGLLAKELEHSDENIARLYAVLKNEGWAQHLLAQLGEESQNAD